ncbi:hypothetical protein RintRC_6010 [Richelia intracellularis]|nr:hypothetical protein RintRC_6010 [Richelia intracellularis]
MKYEFFLITNQSTTCHLRIVAGIIDEMGLVDFSSNCLELIPNK